jgi:hypothetical protein
VTAQFFAMVLRHGYPRTNDPKANIGIGAFVAVAACAARETCFGLAVSYTVRPAGFW